MKEVLAKFNVRSVGSHNQYKALLHIFMQILTPEAAQAEIINKYFTSPGTVLPLPSFDQSVQHLPQHSPGKHKHRESPLGRTTNTHAIQFLKVFLKVEKDKETEREH